MPEIPTRGKPSGGGYFGRGPTGAMQWNPAGGVTTPTRAPTPFQRPPGFPGAPTTSNALRNTPPPVKGPTAYQGPPGVVFTPPNPTTTALRNYGGNPTGALASTARERLDLNDYNYKYAPPSSEYIAANYIPSLTEPVKKKKDRPTRGRTEEPKEKKEKKEKNKVYQSKGNG